MSATNEEIKKAANLGREAFAAGLRPIPGEDAILMALAGVYVHASDEANRRSCTIMRAWVRGWNQARDGK